jgi:DNA-binding transcriptional MerR regulator
MGKPSFPPQGEGRTADERLYSITEAAERLGVSPATIATWIRLGVAKASRQDELGRNRYTEQDLVEMEKRFQERQARKRGGIKPSA